MPKLSNTLNVMERKEAVGVSLMQRPAQKPCVESSLHLGAWDTKDKGKGRTLEEYFKFMPNAGRPPEDGEKKTEALPVMVEMPPPNPNPGGEATSRGGPTLGMYMMSAQWTGSENSATTNRDISEEENLHEPPATIRAHVRFASPERESESGSGADSGDSMEDRQKYGRDNERELLYKQRMQRAEYEKECMERRVGQMIDRVRATEKLVMKTTQKLREAEREKKMVEQCLTTFAQDDILRECPPDVWCKKLPKKWTFPKKVSVAGGPGIFTKLITLSKAEMESICNRTEDPPAPQPLFFMPLVISNTQVRALLDSGASDSFIGEELVRGLNLTTYPLIQRLTVKVANGETLQVTHFVKVSGRLGPMPIRLMLRVIATSLPVVLGYPFLAKLNPFIDFRRRLLRIQRSGKTYEIKALPSVESYSLGRTSPENTSGMEGGQHIQLKSHPKPQDHISMRWKKK